MAKGNDPIKQDCKQYYKLFVLSIVLYVSVIGLGIKAANSSIELVTYGGIVLCLLFLYFCQFKITDV